MAKVFTREMYDELVCRHPVKTDPLSPVEI